jgi:hypothetical protein
MHKGIRLPRGRTIGGPLGIALRWAREHFPEATADDAGLYLGALVGGEGSRAIAERLGRRRSAVRAAILRGQKAVFRAWGEGEVKTHHLRELGLELEPAAGAEDFA